MFNYVCLRDELPHYPETRVINRVAYCIKDGNPTALPVYCQHMGAPLITDGIWKGTCKVHGVTNTPCMKQAHTCGQFVMHGTVPDDVVELLVDASRVMSLSTLFAREVTYGSFTRQMWAENTIDVQHINSIHRAGFARIVDSDSLKAKNLLDGSTIGTMQIKRNAMNGIARRHPGLIANDKFTHAMIGPNLSITTFAGMFLSIEKIQDARVDTSFYAHWELQDKRFLKKLAADNRQILDEDAAMLQSLDAETYKKGILTEDDFRVRHWRRHYG